MKPCLVLNKVKSVMYIRATTASVPVDSCTIAHVILSESLYHTRLCSSIDLS